MRVGCGEGLGGGWDEGVAEGEIEVDRSWEGIKAPVDCLTEGFPKVGEHRPGIIGRGYFVTPYGVFAKHSRLTDGLTRGAVAEFRGTVSCQDKQGDAGKPGFDNGWIKIGGGGSRGADEGNGPMGGFG